MNGEFAQFHIHHSSQENGTISILDVAAEAAGGESRTQGNSATPKKRATKSVLLEGSVYRHNAYLGYQKFERSVTTVLATMLCKENSKALLTLIEEEGMKDSVKNGDNFGDAIEVEMSGKVSVKTNKEKLQVVTIETLIDVLESIRERALEVRDIDETLKTIRSLKDFSSYKTFAYHISFLRQFVESNEKHTRQGPKRGGLDSSGSGVKNKTSSVHGGNVWTSMRVKRGLNDSSTRKARNFNQDSSIAKSTGGLRRVNTATASLSVLSGL
jgi:hypothetical protein